MHNFFFKTKKTTIKTTGLSHLDSFKFPTYPSYLNLKQVQVIHRHGDRSPLSSIPNGFSPVEFICNIDTKGVMNF
jgi:hypothetical protein